MPRLTDDRNEELLQLERRSELARQRQALSSG